MIHTYGETSIKRIDSQNVGHFLQTFIKWKLASLKRTLGKVPRVSV